jgi:hypothetical protein
MSKLTMMATTKIMATGDNDKDGNGTTGGDDDDGDGATGDGAPGYDNDGDGYGATGDKVFSERTNK